MDVSIVEAKNHLCELIRAVEGGEKVVITRHGMRSPNSALRRRNAAKSGLGE
jgi:antitoxin (DNA-binding transcriptional repressor) of toxin-antitoxin stability system